MGWDDRFLDQAFHISQWSKDPSTKVGAVIVDDRKRVVGQGFNGFPRGVIDSPARYNDRPTKYRFVVHAEANAILNSNKQLDGCSIYVTLPPCHECAKLIIQAGITRVVAPKADVSSWAESFETAATMFQEAGVQLYLGSSLRCEVVEEPLAA